MNILIPMAGRGKRFLSAGYNLPKPLLPVNGKTVIEHIVQNFSADDRFIFGVNEDHLKNSLLTQELNRIAPGAVIIPIPYQEEGPVASVRKMLQYAEDDQPVIVNYCDFSWTWNYATFKLKTEDSRCDGAVLCYNGFHPHLLSDRNYATLDAEGLWMKEIREKYSWHESKFQDWSSSGTYYFSRGSLLKKYAEKIRERPQWAINGEHYISQLYQLMREDGLRILIYAIDQMLQWGTPEDYEHYLYASNYFENKSSNSSISQCVDGLSVLMLMAGAGNRFSEEGYEVPKPFIPVDGGFMVEEAARALPLGERYLFLGRRDFQARYPQLEKSLLKTFPNAESLYVDHVTQGQACTALLAKDCIDPNKGLLIGACDHAPLCDPISFAEQTQLHTGIDALIFTYRNNPAVRHRPQMYGWVETAGTRAVTVSVKTPLEGDPIKHHAIMGAFWFRRSSDFWVHAEQMINEDRRVNNEFYIDECMNYLIRAGLNVHVFEVPYFASWGTPDELRTYQYWQRFFSEAAFHPYTVTEPTRA